MPRLTIDGQEIEVADGTTVIQAAEELGITIPHYCYHTDLTRPANCRMCLVEVEKMPKLTTACTQPVADGMVVHTKTDGVRTAQGDVLEFLLKNHPLDCAICDQAGECLLQDYHMEYNAEDSRLREDKFRKRKAKSVGPRIVLDQERCIMCTRCVRFLDEVTGTAELGVFGRGGREVLDVFPGRDVDNEYDLNIVDLCPVGALTDKKFRFKVRSWYLDNKPSVCDGCSTGCAIWVDHNRERRYKNEGKRVVRYRARRNVDVNGSWICNHGRYSFEKHDDGRQITAEVAGAIVPATDAIAHVGEMLKRKSIDRAGAEVGVIVAPSISNEDAWVLRKVFVDGLESPNVDYAIPGLVHGASPGEQTIDGLLRRRDPWPNSRGLRHVGLVPGSGGKKVADMLQAAADGKLTHLVLIGTDLEGSDIDPDLISRALATAYTVWITAHRLRGTSPDGSETVPNGTALVGDPYDTVIPMATYAEYDGTFTNFDDKVQRFWRIVDPLGDSSPLAAVLAGLASVMGLDVPSADPATVFADMTAVLDPMKRLDWDALAAEKDDTVTSTSQWTNSFSTPQL